MASKKKSLPWSLQALAVKSGLMFATIAIGLWCGARDSYSAFYVAALVQSFNNAYESYQLLRGFNKFITGFHLVSFLAAIGSGVIAIIHFAGGNMDYSWMIALIAIALSIPILHYWIEIFVMWREENY